MTFAPVGSILEYKTKDCHFICKVLESRSNNFKGKVLNIFRGECSGYKIGTINNGFAFQFFEYAGYYKLPEDTAKELLKLLDKLEIKFK